MKKTFPLPFISIFLIIIFTIPFAITAQSTDDSTLLTQESIIAQNISAGDNYFDAKTTLTIDLTRRYLSEIYPDREFANIGNYSSGQTLHHMGDYTLWIYHTVYIFADEPDIKNMLTILACGNPNNGFYVAGIFKGEDYNTEDYVEYLKNDPRFSSGIALIEENTYSPEVTEINFTKILQLNDGETVTAIISLDNDNIACVYNFISKDVEPNWRTWELEDGNTYYQRLYENDGTVIYKYAVININTQTVLASGELPGVMPNPTTYGYIANNGFYIHTQLGYGEIDYITYIDKNFNEFTEIAESAADFPDYLTYVGDHRIYHENGGIFELLPNGTSRELVAGNHLPPESEEDYWRYYYSREFNSFYSAVDSDTFLYTIRGVEAELGFGVYSFVTNTATKIPDSNRLHIFGVNGNLVYSPYADWPPVEYRGMYITDLNTFETRSIPELENIWGNLAMTEDCRYAAFINSNEYIKIFDENNNEKPIYSIIVINLQSSEIIREYFISSFLMQCDSVEFLNEGKLLVKATNFALDTNSIFIIDTDLEYSEIQKYHVPRTSDNIVIHIFVLLIISIVSLLIIKSQKE